MIAAGLGMKAFFVCKMIKLAGGYKRYEWNGGQRACCDRGCLGLKPCSGFKIYIAVTCGGHMWAQIGLVPAQGCHNDYLGVSQLKWDHVCEELDAA